METNHKNFFQRLDESLDKTDEVIELKEAIGGAVGLAGKALKQPLKHPIAYGTPAAVYGKASADPEFAEDWMGSPDTIDKMQNYVDWLGMLPGIGDVLDMGSAGIDVAQGQYDDATLRALASIPFIGRFVGGAAGKVIKGTQLPVTAYTFADPIHGGDPFGVGSKSADAKKEPKKEPEKDKKETSWSSYTDKLFQSLADRLEKENEMFTTTQTSPISSYTRTIQPSGPPKIVSGRKHVREQVTFENRVMDISNKITSTLHEATGKAKAGQAIGKAVGETPIGNLTPQQIKKILSDPQTSKALQSIGPFERLRALTRGILSPGHIGMAAAIALPLYYASKFGDPEESEAGGGKDGGKKGAAGLASTQDVLDKMGVSPFGWLKGFSPAAPAIASLAQRSGIKA